MLLVTTAPAASVFLAHLSSTGAAGSNACSIKCGMSIAAHPVAPRHPVAEGVARLHAELEQLAEVPVWSMGYAELGETLVALTRLRARVEELELRVAARADDREVGESSGAANAAAWWAHHTRMTHAEARRRVRLARSLDGPHERVGEALAAGEMLPEQATVVVAAVDALPDDLDPELVQEAEVRLVALAREHDARSLRVLGRRILDVVAPEVGEAHEARQLEKEETAARASCRLTMSDDGHGRCHGRFTLPSAQAAMLRKALLALSSPRRHGSEARPMPQQLGHAFCEYVERYPADRLPDTGGLPATVVVTMTHETLTGGLAAARLDTGELLSPGQSRRLACEAGIIPAVLGGPSQVLDLGRRRRFHSATQRVALGLRDGGCTAEGCDMPPGLCHAHHDDPWASGGPTSVRRGRLLCSRHHTLAHHSEFDTRHLPGGKVAFVRRT